MTSDPIPVRESLDAIYGTASLAAQGVRWKNLVEAFEERYGAPPAYVARAPGRVNIIGEHIDYAGFSVLPSAIEPDVLIAARALPNEGSTSTTSTAAVTVTVEAANVDPRYPRCAFSYDSPPVDGSPEVAVDASEKAWENYLKAGLNGVLAALRHHHESGTGSESGSGSESAPVPERLQLLFDGTVPPGSGLSSSAAMTTASAIAVWYAYGASGGMGRKEVTEVAVVSERAVGVNSGGMDQTASVFGERGKLLHIEFQPELSSRPLALPPASALSFVIANTLVTADKHKTAKMHYNLRVVETRIAARILAKHFGMSTLRAVGPGGWTLKALADERVGSGAGVAGLSASRWASELQGLIDAAEGGCLGPEEGLTWEEARGRLGMDGAEFQREVVGGFEVEAPDGKVKVLKRARHVLSEARRVYLFCDALEHPSPSATDTAKVMADLMNASHRSCRDEYDCSCPELDELVDLALASGALGSRLTGAGWGGSTVHLVPEGKESEFIAALREGYYAKRFPGLGEEQLKAACFATKPEGGACVYVVPSQ